MQMEGRMLKALLVATVIVAIFAGSVRSQEAVAIVEGSDYGGGGGGGQSTNDYSYVGGPDSGGGGTSPWPGGGGNGGSSGTSDLPRYNEAAPTTGGSGGGGGNSGGGNSSGGGGGGIGVPGGTTVANANSDDSSFGFDQTRDGASLGTGEFGITVDEFVDLSREEINEDTRMRMLLEQSGSSLKRLQTLYGSDAKVLADIQKEIMVLEGQIDALEFKIADIKERDWKRHGDDWLGQLKRAFSKFRDWSRNVNVAELEERQLRIKQSQLQEAQRRLQNAQERLGN
jgi:hypothetical protein